jgi:two-component system cell cycle response regulator
VEILLVEDNIGDIRLTEDAFRDAKMLNKLSVVRDGIEALAFLRREGAYASAVRPDLILLDLNLPKKDGRDVLAEVKTDQDLRQIPVVILTTSEAEQDVLKAYDLHANCYITKPVDLEKFFSVVESIEQFWLSVVVLPRRIDVALQSIRVLLVEDNPGDARLLSEMLSDADKAWRQSNQRFDVVHCDRLSSGLLTLEQGGIDVVLLDLSLPDATGSITVTRTLETAPNVPIVVLTGTDNKELAISAVDHGVQDYLVKGQVGSASLVRSLRYAIERKRGELALRETALRDGLTGLANRTLLQDRLEMALAQAKRNGRLAAVLFMDLDHFKEANDAHGHLYGDQVLVDIAQRLRMAVREADTVARYGGDEFVVVLAGLAEPAQAEEVAQRIIGALAKPFGVGGSDVTLGVSMGISIFPADGSDAQALLQNADAALYEAKEHGRDHSQRFTASNSEPS